MKVALRELAVAYMALNELMQNDLPPSVAFKLADVWRRMEPAIDNYNDRMEEIREKHNIDNGTALSDLDPDVQDEIESLREIEVPLGIEPISRNAIKQDIKPSLLLQTYFLWENGNSESKDGGE